MMSSSGLVTTVILAGLLAEPSASSDDDALRLTNITVHMMRHGGAVSRIEAKIVNPNDFAVYDVVAACDFKDRRSAVLSSSNVKFVDAVVANATRIIRDFPIEAWPQQARAADCVSQHAKRLPG
jgi:hypothetical protein